MLIVFTRCTLLGLIGFNYQARSLIPQIIMIQFTEYGKCRKHKKKLVPYGD